MGPSTDALGSRQGQASGPPASGRGTHCRKGPFDAVVDASNAVHLPALALDVVEPAGRLVYIGLAGRPSLVDTRVLALKDVTAVGILSATPGLAAAIEAHASGAVDPRPLVAATVGLDEVGAVLAGERPERAGPGPRIHIDPRVDGYPRVGAD